MERFKQTIIYLHLLHAIWTDVDYYSRLFGIDAGEEPAKIPSVHIERGELNIFRFRFPSYTTPNSQNYTLDEMREIMQQYLDYCILPEQTTLCPYMGGNTVYDILEPLYIDNVERQDGYYYIDVIYINDPLSYRYVQNKKWKGDLL